MHAHHPEPDAGVDLVYLDPPLNSDRDDNVIVRDESGNATDAQLLAFEDSDDTYPSGRPMASSCSSSAGMSPVTVLHRISGSTCQ